MPDTPQQQEWLALQSQFAAHEVHALQLRMLAVALFAVISGLGWHLRVLGLALLMLWLLEAMLRTTQSRLGQRLLLLEASGAPGLQLHSWWAAQRGGAVALLSAYVCAALRPTVALPYVLLLIGTACLRFL
ncbi:hypothetical protein [Viridibacterium curvum]|uniref:Uncharacterized protein n=1 Tax=Viridibacterium curvum TaxID=1101404 RepID=A0ABP9QQ15_9RHOO